MTALLSTRPMPRVAALLAVACCGVPIGCPPEPADDDDATTPSGPLEMDPGDVADLVVQDGVASVEVADAGVYVLALTSTAEGQGTLFGYGDNAEEEPQDTGARGTPPPPPPAGPADGERGAEPPFERTFRVSDGSALVQVVGELRGISDGVALYEDVTTEPPYEPDWDAIGQAVGQFATIVMPRERQVFGPESDVDGGGWIDVLVSGTVNEYGAQAYVSPCDIAAFDGCWATGNGSEVIYLSVPDPDDVYSSPNAFTETMAHEVNHLIYSWHKFVLTEQLSASENIYVTEGMSALAQDLSGYNNGNQYVWWAAVDASDFYGSDAYSVQSLSVNDILAGTGYYDEDRDGPLRGGAYLLLRYLFEQAGGMQVDEDTGELTDLGGMAWLHDFLDTPFLGVDAIEQTTLRELPDLAQDFYTCLLLDGRDLSSDPRWNFEPRIEDPLTGYSFGVDMFALIHGWAQMTGPLIQELGEADGWVFAGGVEYLRVEVDDGGSISLPVDPDSLPRVRLVRFE